MSTSASKRQQILVDVQSMLEEWNQQAEQFGYSGSGDFTDTGKFEIEEYSSDGNVIATHSARVVFD